MQRGDEYSPPFKALLVESKALNSTVIWQDCLTLNGAIFSRSIYDKYEYMYKIKGSYKNNSLNCDLLLLSVFLAETAVNKFDKSINSCSLVSSIGNDLYISAAYDSK